MKIGFLSSKVSVTFVFCCFDVILCLSEGKGDVVSNAVNSLVSVELVKQKKWTALKGLGKRYLVSDLLILMDLGFFNLFLRSLVCLLLLSGEKQCLG